MSLLRCYGVRKAWGGVHALNGIDLAVAPNEVLALAGANGAGKTTLLNAVGGQIVLDEGGVELLDRRVETLTPVVRRRLGIARTFQAIRVFTQMTTLENVALAAAYGLQRILPPLRLGQAALATARAALSLVRLDESQQTVAGELGVYEQKRLMLAMAIVPQPRLLLLDEPAAGLSPKEIDETVGILRTIGDLGTTLIVVDHVMSFLREVADRMVVLHEGEVLAQGTPGEMMRDQRVRERWLGHIGAGVDSI